MSWDRLGPWLDADLCERKMLNSQETEGIVDTVREGGRVALERRRESERWGQTQLGFVGLVAQTEGISI